MEYCDSKHHTKSILIHIKKLSYIVKNMVKAVQNYYPSVTVTTGGNEVHTTK
jgi:hypothetical protein